DGAAERGPGKNLGAMGPGGQVVLPFRPPPGSPLTLAFSPDGKRLAVPTVANRRCRCWDVASGQELPPFGTGSPQVAALAFHPDGQTLVSGGQDGAIRLWEVAGGKALRQFQGQQGPVLSLALSADGRTLAVGGERTVRLWDLAQGRELLPWA